jgi:hypothetical protein
MKMQLLERKNPMRGHINIKSAAIGGVMGVLTLLLVGAAGGPGDMPVIGRFQIACANAACFLVDTATGQVWMTGNPGFWDSKLGAPAPAAEVAAPAASEARTQRFVGQWTPEDPQSNNINLRIDADGFAIATDGSNRYEGRWSALGSRIVINLGEEVLMGTLQDDGRLIVGEPDNEEDRVTLRRVP